MVNAIPFPTSPGGRENRDRLTAAFLKGGALSPYRTGVTIMIGSTASPRAVGLISFFLLGVSPLAVASNRFAFLSGVNWPPSVVAVGCILVCALVALNFVFWNRDSVVALSLYCLGCVVVSALALSWMAYWDPRFHWWHVAIACTVFSVGCLLLILREARNDRQALAEQARMYDVYYFGGMQETNQSLPAPAGYIAFAKSVEDDAYLIPVNYEWRECTRDEAVSRLDGTDRACANPDGCSLPAADGDIYCIHCRARVQE